MYMQTGLLALIAVATPLVQAHSAVAEFFVNGKGRGAGTCIRMNTDGKVNMFIDPITSQDMACGINGAGVVGRTCPIQAGDTVSFMWRARPGEEDDQRPIYDNHLGPCSVYMKQIATGEPAADGSFPASPPAAGDGWFKIMYDDKDATGEWCTERLRVSKDGAVSVEIPNDVKPGYYLLRPELISLTHARQGGPQIWADCVQVYISGGSGTANPQTIKIPGYVQPSDEAMNYNVYTEPAPPLPEIGGPVYKAGGAEVKTPTKLINKVSTTSASAAATTSSDTNADTKAKRSMRIAGRASWPMTKLEQRQSPTPDPFGCPADTIMELGNACLPAYPTWTDTDKDAMPNCKAAQDKCFAMGDKCFDITNPAVNNKEGHGCRVYRDKCNEIKQACIDKVMSGPTDPNKVITPAVGILSEAGITRRDAAPRYGSPISPKDVVEALKPLRRRVASFFTS